jgi:dihydroneopterin aldolase
LSLGICIFLVPMGLIQIENMEFYAFHGHYREEQIVGNKFLVNLSIDSDMTVPAATDNLKDAINYQRVYKLVKEEMQKKSRLLENIAKRILDTIFANFDGIREVTVKVSKMNPPMGGGRIEKVSVTLNRKDEDSRHK